MNGDGIGLQPQRPSHQPAIRCLHPLEELKWLVVALHHERLGVEIRTESGYPPHDGITFLLDGGVIRFCLVELLASFWLITATAAAMFPRS